MDKKIRALLVMAVACLLFGCEPHAGPDRTILVNLEAKFQGTSEWETVLKHPCTYQWDFGDGVGAAVGKNVSYRYSAVGDYTVTMTVKKNKTGWTAKDYVFVSVIDWEILPVPIPVGGRSIDNPVVGFLPSGKMAILDSNTLEVVAETASSVPHARSFRYVTTLTPGGFAWGSFVQAVNENEVLVETSYNIFRVDLTTGSVTEVGRNLYSYDAALSGNTLFVAAGDFSLPASKLYSVDLTSGTPVDLLTDLPGASGGVCLDGAGNLYAGNGFAYGAPNETGEIRKFSLARPVPWAWYTDGELVADILIAGSLVRAGNGKMVVGGGDFFGGGETNFFAAVDLVSG